MNIGEIKDLVSQFDQSTLTEFDLREGQFELYMNKNNTSRGNAPAAAPAAVQETVSAPAETAPAAQAPEAAAAAQTSAPAFDGVEIVSPIVGVVYLQPSPEKPAFKKVGDPVAKGEVICIIEAMKLMNEITSDVDGEIAEILVENEEVVEFGQPLFRIQPK
ncbi:MULTISPECIES: acetyl-CoA carboxylase biotin carboxyl carrier protein [unclassified Enterococcus]|uniref:acetyl-CoA carboxylase biotin carboxyl carrier protein n=1 Tax=unclassified Enterococcus TaxID=2608891 RepID=UPI003D29A729